MHKKRGGFTGIELMALIGVIGLVVFFVAPPMGKAINNVFTGSRNQHKQVHNLKEQYPVFYQTKEGTYKPASKMYQRIEKDLNFVAEQPPETLWQKFMKLGAMAVAIIVLLSYLGLWPIIMLWWKKRVLPKIQAQQAALEAEKAQKAELKDDAKLIVISVDEGLASIDASIKRAFAIANASADVRVKDVQNSIVQALDKAKEDFLTAMSRKQDKTTKNLVRELLKND